MPFLICAAALLLQDSFRRYKYPAIIDSTSFPLELSEKPDLDLAVSPSLSDFPLREEEQNRDNVPETLTPFARGSCRP